MFVNGCSKDMDNYNDDFLGLADLFQQKSKTQAKRRKPAAIKSGGKLQGLRNTENPGDPSPTAPNVLDPPKGHGHGQGGDITNMVVIDSDSDTEFGLDAKDAQEPINPSEAETPSLVRLSDGRTTTTVGEHGISAASASVITPSSSSQVSQSMSSQHTSDHRNERASSSVATSMHRRTGTDLAISVQPPQSTSVFPVINSKATGPNRPLFLTTFFLTIN